MRYITVIFLLITIFITSCGRQDPPGVTEAEQEKIYTQISKISAGDYFNALYQQVPENPIPSYGHTEMIPLNEVWPVFEYGYTTSAVNLRLGPSSKESIIRVVPIDELIIFRLVITDRPERKPLFDLFLSSNPNWNLTYKDALENFKKGPWINVTYSGTSGWLHSAYVRTPNLEEIRNNSNRAINFALKDTFTWSGIGDYWIWLFWGLPTAIIFNLVIFFFYGDIFIYLDGKPFIKWKNFAGIFAPAIFYLTYAIEKYGLVQSEYLEYLITAAIIIFVIGIPSTIISNYLQRYLELRPVSYAENNNF